MTAPKHAARGAWRKVVLFVVLGLVVLGWAVAGVVFVTVPEQRSRLIALGVALFATEAAIWIGAILFGLKIAEARGEIWRRIKRGFRRSDAG